MADRSQKEPTPPPLLLMPAGAGLTLNPPDQPSLLMPVVQSEPSLFGQDEEGEADSFVGQGPAVSSELPQTSTPLNYFNSAQSATHTSNDPFAAVGHYPPPAPPTMNNIPMSQPMSHIDNPGLSQLPPAISSPGGNMFRKVGSSRYAQAPMTSNVPTNVPPPSGPYPPTTPYQSPPANELSRPPTMGTNYSQFPSTGGSPPAGAQGHGYHPVQPHWCYCKKVETKDMWYPFSLLDSLKLEEALKTAERRDSEDIVISTVGGRYDVNVAKRIRTPIYWEEDPTEVRRCTWFYRREGDNRYVPYAEDFSVKLEDEYHNALQFNTWHKRLEFPDGETIVMHNPNVIVHFQASSQPDEWGNVQGDQMRPRVVKRGVEDFESIEDGESAQVDHLVLMVHGIGANCDHRFRSLVECVDDFRSIGHSLIDTHFQRPKSEGRVHRVEFLPVHWHGALHSDATGIDKRLKGITLPSTPKLRNFVNDTLIDILFYTSPSYCQLISKTVGDEMNRLYKLFLKRNPTFKGTISVAGHSLGSSILFDLLLHQNTDEVEVVADVPDSNNVSDTSIIEPPEVIPEVNGGEGDNSMTLEQLLSSVGLEEKLEIFYKEQIDMESLIMCSESDLKDLGLPMGPRKKLQGVLKEEAEKKAKVKRRAEELEKAAIAKVAEEEEKEQTLNKLRCERQASMSVDYYCALSGTGQPIVHYPQLNFTPSSLFALGSPIGVFLSVRGVDNVGEDFKLPTCPHMLNIFHPFDPVAYRLEPLVNPATAQIKPFLIPHHKGRKRLHLELKESLTRVGVDLKNKLMDSLRTTWNTIHDFAMAHKTAPSAESLQEQVDQEMSNVIQQLQHSQVDDKAETSSVASSHDDDISMGQLNDGRRIDYVLQEKPIESFNDYLFALASHGCYWESEDTVLLLLKELYAMIGISPQMPGPESAHQRAAGPPTMSSLPFTSAAPGPMWSPPTPARQHPPPAGFSPPPFSNQSQNPSNFPTQSQTPSPFSSPYSTPPHGASAMHTPPMVGQGHIQSAPPSSSPYLYPGAADPGQPAGPPPMSGFVRSPPN